MSGYGAPPVSSGASGIAPGVGDVAAGYHTWVSSGRDAAPPKLPFGGVGRVVVDEPERAEPDAVRTARREVGGVTCGRPATPAPRRRGTRDHDDERDGEEAEGDHFPRHESRGLTSVPPVSHATPMRPPAHSGTIQCRARGQRRLRCRHRDTPVCHPGWHLGCSTARRRSMLGLVLTAGGARGAYQAGVLKRLGQVPSLYDAPSPFAIVAGASAGAINGAMVAAGSARFRDARPSSSRTSGRASRSSHVFRTDALSLGFGAVGLLRDMVMGGPPRPHRDAGAPRRRAPSRAPGADAPPRGHRRGDPRRAPLRVRRDGDELPLGAVLHLRPGATWPPDLVEEPSRRPARRADARARLRLGRHSRSSSRRSASRTPAGELYFGDGGLRLVTPFSPAIRLGATHVFAHRHPLAARRRCRSHARSWATAEESGAQGSVLVCPPLAQICGVFLNAIFLDHLDTDLDHLRRMNELILAYRRDAQGTAGRPSVSEPMRVVTPLVVSPSEDLALVAQRFAHRMPRIVRYLMEGLGTPDAQSADLMSYLLFDAAYTRALIDIGYRDASDRIDEIEAFLHSVAPSAARSEWREASSL